MTKGKITWTKGQIMHQRINVNGQNLLIIKTKEAIDGVKK